MLWMWLLIAPTVLVGLDGAMTPKVDRSSMRDRDDRVYQPPMR